MPAEIFDVEKFIQLSEKARYCIVKRLKDEVKLKIKTKKYLYTLKVDPAKAEEIIKQVKCEVREV
jgi:large subunit ribosomal protein L38e